MLLVLATVAAAATGTPVAVLQAHANGKLLALHVRVGHRPFEFVVDTGAPHTVIDSAAATMLALPVRSEDRQRGAGQGTVRELHVAPLDVGLGPVSLHVDDPLVIDLANTGTSQAIDGLVGADLFERYVVRMDPLRRTLTLFEPATFRHPGPGTTVPLHVENHRLFVDMTFTLSNGVSATHRVRIDTGSEDAASDDLVKQSPERRLARQGVGLGTPYVDYSGVFERIRIGRYVVRHAWGASNARPTVGMEILRRFTMTFDVPHRRLYLEPNAHLRDRVPAPSG